MSPSNQVAYIYNPLNQTEEELRKNFVVREKEFNTIFNDIKSSSMQHPEPHYVIQAQRGQGKTTLLLKLYYEVKRDEELNKFIVPVIFNEEQYHINSLFGLWSHAADKLEEENMETFPGIYDAIEKLYGSSNPEEDAFKYLESALKKEKKKLVLFIDNVGQLFDKLDKKEQHRLREVLITSPEIRLIGASAEVLEYTYDYSKPFYELFRIITLEGLTQKETITLLSKLGEYYKQENIKKIIQKARGRIETMRRLTSGVPRTLVLLFEIFVDHENGNAFMDLEFVLDRVTPLYKHRMDDLPTQQQKIVDAIALNWDAIAAKDIAAKTRMQSKVISSQLKVLEKKRIVHKITTTTKNHLYQVSERFFNIWYIMRYGRRRGKNRVQWLVRFLECWCSETELAERAHQHLEALQKRTLHTKHALYFTEALAASKLSYELQHELIIQTRDFLQKHDEKLSKELIKSDVELYNKALKHLEKEEYYEALKKLESVHNKNGEILCLIAEIYYMQFQDFDKAEKHFLQAVKKGEPSAMSFLSLHYFKIHKHKKKALELAQKAVKKNNSTENIFLLGMILLWSNEIEESLKLERQVLKNEELINNETFLVYTYIILLMSKKQYNAALSLFNVIPLNLKERLAPIYFALMYFYKDDYPDEYKKMGQELKETVEEVIKKVHQMEKDYA